MRKKEKNGVIWLEFEQLQPFPEVQHGVFLRHGGVSTGEYASLNSSPITGDDVANVEENLRRIQKALGISGFAAGEQCHGNRVEEVSDLNTWSSPACDGLITQRHNVALLTRHADCQTALFYHPGTHVIANVHCGWKGNVVNIYQATVEALHQKFGCPADELLVCIGPSLGPAVAEFVNYRAELPESFWEFKDANDCFDLWAIAKEQLLQSGIRDTHIEIASICTKSNPKDFFSYRRSKQSGRHATVAMLRPLIAKDPEQVQHG